MRKASVLLLCSSVVACQQAETPQQADARIIAESNAARPELESITLNLERLFAAGAIDSAAALLADDYVALPPNQPATAGRAQWLSSTKPLFAAWKVTQSHVTESVVANGPLAVLRGRYMQGFVPAPGAPAGAKAFADTGKYLWQFRKVNGQWLFAVGAWNSDLPAKK